MRFNYPGTTLILASIVSLLPVAGRGEDDVPGPYMGPSIDGVDTSTLTGKVMCGYQGWFNCEGDGMESGWTHWAANRRKPFAPGNVTVDLWPDMSEFDADERYATGFVHSDGRVAEVFSSANGKTIQRHFRWMRDYGIDGAFVQRFANGLKSKNGLRHKNVVLTNARESANRNGRAYAVMYDLSGLKSGEVDVVREDWQWLRETMKITDDPAYLNHEGAPLVAVWGIGFSEKGKPRDYSLSECRELITALKNDGCTVMLGVPTGWRNLDRDADSDPELHRILELADVVSPWTVGRYRTPEGVERHAGKDWKPDLSWCKERDIDYLPVVFPGFSWHNLTGQELGAIPRLKGKFLWSQIVAAKQTGCEMIYVAMFDEVDEGTAIFKCTDDPPVGADVSFLSYEGMASDHYLRLTGMGGKLLRGEISSSAMPFLNNTGQVPD